MAGKANKMTRLPDSRRLLADKKKLLNAVLLNKYASGKGVKIAKLRRGIKQHQIQRKEKKYKKAQDTTARAEILLTENRGLLESSETTYTAHITQKEIRKAVDISAATKSFDLALNQFGPYRFRYTGNGRHMVLGGRKGHLASFDWITKKLHFESNVTESIHDVCFLHTEQMIAVAQKKWTYIYDNQGIELHCLKQLDHVTKLEFLPYHFLLCSGSESGFLSWLDVTLGKEVIQFNSRKGRIDVMRQNPYNAVLCLGHTNGTVSMWTPNVNEPVFQMLCNPHPLRAIDFDPSGKYLATGGVDGLMRIWDTRNLGKMVSSYKVISGISHLAFSQTNLLSVAHGNVVDVFKNVTRQDDCELYMSHTAGSTITGIQFCPYEDVLGVSAYRGYSSLLIPGSGEANFDALESNPFSSVSSRRETEVKAILEKIPSEIITLDISTISQIDVPTLEEKLEAKKKLKYLKVPKLDLQPRYRMKGKSGSAKKFKRKSQMKEDEKREYIKFIKEKQKLIEEKDKKPQDSEPVEILDRFKPKKRILKN